MIYDSLYARDLYISKPSSVMKWTLLQVDKQGTGIGVTISYIDDAKSIDQAAGQESYSVRHNLLYNAGKVG